MLKSQIDSAALFLAVVAAAMALTLFGSFGWLASIAGLTLVFVLLAYDRDGYRSVFQSLAFSAVFSLCLTLAIAIIFRLIADSDSQSQNVKHVFSGQWLPALWACVTAVFWPIDRARMSGRVQYSGDLVTAPAASGGITTQRFITPAPITPPPAATVVHPEQVYRYSPPQAAPPEVVPEPRPVPIPTPAPAVYPAPVPQAAPFPQPAPTPQPAYIPAPPPPPEPVFTPPAPAPQVSFVSQPPAPAPQPAYAPQPTPQAYMPPQPVPVANAIPVQGKETMIYVNLVGEGLNVMRAVRAEPLGRDFYRIIDTMPEGEIWQYGPGVVVKCKKKNLSSGKAMVAVEEAPRSQ